MADFKLNSPRLLAVRGSVDAPELLEVQTTHPDLVAWDTTRRKHGWGSFQDDMWKWLGFISWHAARRTQAIPQDLRFEEWEASLLEVQNLDSDEVPPTPEAVELDSSAS